MLPVLTPAEMGAVDAAAPEPVEVLIGRAGAATARQAIDLLGGTYGRRVVVVAGKGNNGNDGRDAAARLRRRGVLVTEIPAAEAPRRLPPADLVIDAAYGTGFRGEYEAPDPAGAPVLAVDIPSGVDGLTGQVAAGGDGAESRADSRDDTRSDTRGGPDGHDVGGDEGAGDGSPVAAVRADRTITFAALKPGLLFHPGRELAGAVVLADIGLDVSGARIGVVEAADVAGWLPARPPDAHKWRSAVVLAAGSAGMAGAAHLAARAAQRAGAGMVRVASPGIDQDPGLPTEAVGIPVPPAGWDVPVLAQLDRARALVIGPGLGLGAPAEAVVHHLVASAGVPVVVDGDGLTALGGRAADVIGRRTASTVLTPHDGEYARLAGHPPAADRIAEARALAATTGAVVLLKGATTVVADPGGQVLLSTAGDARLATAGTGDVLSGVIGALLAQGVDAFAAAAAGAWLHGRAAESGPPRGLVASDVVDGLPTVLAALDALDAPPSSSPVPGAPAGGA
jgi:ADP-dependent NAD(P)H-hydrate dehydratase / NAD(P)H-hydrate epimerase